MGFDSNRVRRLDGLVVAMYSPHFIGVATTRLAKGLHTGKSTSIMTRIEGSRPNDYDSKFNNGLIEPAS